MIREILSMTDVSAAAWNRLDAGGSPFLRHEYLAALEQHGCAIRRTGWEHSALLLTAEDGGLLGAFPQYRKHHSMGEFVFDFAWADAYSRLGLRYYPKRICAIPFTPVPGPRFLLAAPSTLSYYGWRPAEACLALLKASLERTACQGDSSWHCLFPETAQAHILRDQGLIMRKGYRFLWTNAGYRSFEDFLACLTAKKRKKIKRERRRIREAEIEVEMDVAERFDTSIWQELFPLYASTYLIRGQAPYLNLGFFQTLHRSLARNMVLALARHKRRLIAGAIFFRDAERLYGRHWGASDDYHSLHFELCYYRGIEYCIEQGLSTFDPGTQGEHKVPRGFLPSPTWSAHWLADSRLQLAVADFARREAQMMDRYAEEVRAHSPYRAETATANQEAP